MPELRVAIDARLESGVAGGVESVVIGLAHGLAGLDGGNERYLFLCRDGSTDWLEPYLGTNSDIIAMKSPEFPNSVPADLPPSYPWWTDPTF